MFLFLILILIFLDAANSFYLKKIYEYTHYIGCVRADTISAENL